MYGPEAAARALCARCPVREVCLWSTLCSEEQGSRFGVAGGASPSERELLAASVLPEALAAARDRALAGWRVPAYSPPPPAALASPVTAMVGQGERDPVSSAVAAVAVRLGVPAPAMVGPRRGGRAVAEARQALMFALYEGLSLSYSEIGRRLHRDHATVMHGVARAEQRAAASPLSRRQLDALVLEVCAVREGTVPDPSHHVDSSTAAGAVRATVRVARRRRRDASDENSALAQAALRVVAEDYGLSIVDLRGPSRGAAVVEARQTAMYVLHRAAALSYPGIGRALGGRDQTTARHGVARAADLACRSEAARRRLDRLCRQARMTASPGERGHGAAA